MKKSGPAAKSLQSPEEFQSFIEQKSVTIVGYFEDLESDAAKLFTQLADSIDDHPFGLVSDYSKFSNLEHKDTLVLYKDVCFFYFNFIIYNLINVLYISIIILV